MASWTPGSADLTDVWFFQVNGAGSWFRNGKGARLQAGRATVGSDTWVSRSFFLIDVTGLFSAITKAADMTDFLVTFSARGVHSCIGLGPSPAVYFQRVTSSFPTENTEAGECSGANPVAVPPSTTTNRVAYANASLTAGDSFTVDLINIVKDLYAIDSSGATALCFVMVGQDESSANNRMAVNSRESGTTWSAIAHYSTASTPATPGSLTPSNQRLVGGTTSRTFGGTYSNSDGSALNAVEVLMATSNHVDGNGKLDTGLITVTGTSFTISAGVFSAPRTLSVQTRGVRYYWQCRVTSANAVTSAWSAVKYIDVNQLPTLSVP